MKLEELNKKLLQRSSVRKAMEENRVAYEIAEMIIDARIRKGLTQSELAKKVGTKQPSIARIERGESSPSISFLEKIAAALGMKLVSPKFEDSKEVKYSYSKDQGTSEKQVVNVSYYTNPFSVFSERNSNKQKIGLYAPVKFFNDGRKDG